MIVISVRQALNDVLVRQIFKDVKTSNIFGISTTTVLSLLSSFLLSPPQEVIMYGGFIVDVLKVVDGIHID